ncbi:MAG: hypothetical protein AAF266_11840, partial [Planctomycetota bacterium]
NPLLESPIAVAAIGLLLITLAGIWYVQTRSMASVAALAVAVLLTIGGVAFERSWLTPREQVTRAVGQLFDAIEANDLPGVLALIDARATEVAADAESLMPRFRVMAASEGGEVRVTLPDDASADGAVATARLKPLIKVQHAETGTTGAYFDCLELDVVRRGETWQLQAYRPAKDWRDGAARLER